MDGVVSDMAEPAPIIKAYDAIAPHYAEYSSKRGAYLDAIDRLVVARLRAEHRWLDVGCGDGRRLAKIRSDAGVADVVAVEPSAEMARICHERTGIEVHRAVAEDLASLDMGTFDRITALWNIFGHIGGSALRITALRAMRAKLRPGGLIMLDVNNRHNASAYGRMRVCWRRVIDAIAFRESRGDATYDWKIGDQVFQGSGHLFTPGEMAGLFAQAGLVIQERCSVHYATGVVSPSPFAGQLAFVLSAREPRS